MENVVNLFSPATEGVEDIERSFKLLGGKISKKELAEEAYDTLMDADFEGHNKRLSSEKAWDIAALYELGEDKIEAAKEINLECDREYLRNSRRSDVVEIPAGETKESFLKCRIGNLKRIQDLYFTSILRNSNCFSGAIEDDLIVLEQKMASVVKQMEDLQ